MAWAGLLVMYLGLPAMLALLWGAHRCSSAVAGIVRGRQQGRGASHERAYFVSPASVRVAPVAVEDEAEGSAAGGDGHGRSLTEEALAGKSRGDFDGCEAQYVLLLLLLMHILWLSWSLLLQSSRG